MSVVTKLALGVPAERTAGTAADSPMREQIALAAREFEAMFLLQMLKQMRQSMLAEEVEEPGLGSATMTETVDVELARHLSGRPGGLFDVLSSAFSGGSSEAAIASPSGALAPGPPAALQRSVVAAAVPAAVAAPVSAAAATSQLQLPEGRISSKFGWRADPLTGAHRFHTGVDIAAAYGDQVEAAAAGRVVFAGVQGGYGQTVVLEHEGGLQTRYAHLSQLDVAVGDTVAQGGTIGRVGRSGRATGAHLHFEVLEDGRRVNPLRAGELNRRLKVERAGADYPTGTSRRAVPTGVDDEN